MNWSRLGRWCVTTGKSETTPWPRDKMERHITQRIREYADIAYRYQMHDGEVTVYMREGGEDAMWAVIRDALADAGWGVIPR